MQKPNNFFFIDIETTGLDEKDCIILEVAVIITDSQLNALYHKSWVLTAYDTELARMNAWCKTQHEKSGLIKEVKLSCITPRQVEFELIALAQKYFSGEKVILAGNSVHFDKRFIEQYMPEFKKLLHFRIIDVSSFMETFKRVFNYEAYKNMPHRALQDAQSSLDQLKDYLSFHAQVLSKETITTELQIAAQQLTKTKTASTRKEKKNGKTKKQQSTTNARH